MLRVLQAFGAHHFAFLRATFQGLDARTAWRRYLGFADDLPEAPLLDRLRVEMLDELLQRAEAVGRRLGQNHPVHQARAVLARGHDGRRATSGQATARPAPSAKPWPSLDEFIAESGLEADTYSETEWLALYREQHGAADDAAARPATAIDPEFSTTAPPRQAIAERVRALAVLEPWVSRTPQPEDLLGLWLAPPTAARLQAHGWQRLEQLGQAIARDGARWWHPVPRLGRIRARALEAWLVDLHRAWQRPLPVEALDAQQRARRRWLGRDPAREGARSSPSAGSVTRDWPSVLSPAPSRRGAAAAPVAAPAPEDGLDGHGQQAIQAWLARHRAPAATWRAYRKEAERLWWWCATERGRPVAALGAEDLRAFHGFLRQPPTSWVNPAPLPRSDPDWRPFRAPLSLRSADQALRVVRSLLAGLQGVAAPPRQPATDDAAASLRTAGHRPSPPRPMRPSTPRASASPGSGPRHRRAAALPAVPERPSARDDAAARRWALLARLVGATGGTAADALAMRVHWSPAAGHWVLTPPAGQAQIADPALAALIVAHRRDAGLPATAPSPAPVLWTLRPGVRRWTVQGEDVALAAWPRSSIPRPWSAAALARAWGRRVIQPTDAEQARSLLAGA